MQQLLFAYELRMKFNTWVGYDERKKTSRLAEEKWKVTLEEFFC